jgi:hypothetical protein
MNEDQLITLLSNLDDDLIENEVNTLLEGVEIDMDSIKEKAYQKISNNGKKIKHRRKFTYVAAACIGLLSITTVYADDISQAIKSFFNTTPVYSTIVDGKAYYLKEGHALNEHIKIESVMVSDGKLEMEISSDSDIIENELGDISVISKDQPNTVYGMGGYSKEDNKLLLSFWNKTESNYNIKPFKDFKLTISKQTFDVSLEEAKSFDLNSNIYTDISSKSSNIEGVNVGARIVNEKEKQNIQLVAAFEDKDLKLVTFGTPLQKKAVSKTEYRGSEDIIGSGTSSMPEDLYVLDEANNKYKLEIPKDSTGSPVTLFETNAPKDTRLTLKLPAIVTYYPKTMSKLSLDIPQKEQIDLNKEIDFNRQKAVIKNIKRLSSTSAQVEFDLNIGSNKEVTIRSFNADCPGVKSIETEFNGDKAVMTIEYDENTDKVDMEIGYPYFVMNGDWTLVIK